MHYAIHKQNKEHRVISGSAQAMAFGVSDDWRVVEADADGWIKHDGGECPLPGNHACDVKTERGSADFYNAKSAPWYCIAAYRPIISDKEQDMSEQEWDGEGLPPVGCEVEALDDYGWSKAEWFKHHNGQHAVFFTRPRSLGWADEIRPLRTAAQRAEDAIAEVLPSACSREGKARAIYAAIREGRIPGVRLEDV